MAPPLRHSSVGILTRWNCQDINPVANGVDDAMCASEPGRTKSLEVAKQLSPEGWLLIEPSNDSFSLCSERRREAFEVPLSALRDSRHRSRPCWRFVVQFGKSLADGSHSVGIRQNVQSLDQRLVLLDTKDHSDRSSMLGDRHLATLSEYLINDLAKTLEDLGQRRRTHDGPPPK